MKARFTVEVREARYEEGVLKSIVTQPYGGMASRIIKLDGHTIVSSRTRIDKGDRLLITIDLLSIEQLPSKGLTLVANIHRVTQRKA